MPQQVHFFSSDIEQTLKGKDKLGGKGANLAEMSSIGIPIPPGFIITTDACREYLNEKQLNEKLKNEIINNFKKLENKIGKGFGDIDSPLLVSVRSGAPISMPGMMDTILNIGLNDVIVEQFAKINKKFAYDSYRRLLQMYGTVVLNIEYDLFESAMLKLKYNETEETDKELVDEYKKIILQHSGKDFPQDVYEQLFSSVECVFKSWNGDRAKTYRNKNNIPHDLFTAVNVQAMVFGNMNDDSCTGVLFTRNPIDGTNKLFGEFLINAQGEDVVSGYYNTNPITKDDAMRCGAAAESSMEITMPEIFNQLSSIAKKLEKHYCDMQDIEFTVQERKLWILQARNGKRSCLAAAKIAVDMVKEGLISEKQAIKNIDSSALEQVLHPNIDPLTNKQKPIAMGLAASPGGASGAIALSSHKAEIIAKHQNVILVRDETSPEDIAGMYAAQGILTNRGGVTSHAAVVARGMGKPCICGTGNIVIHSDGTLTIAGQQFSEGEIITINGSSGEIFAGAIPMKTTNITEELSTILGWFDKHSTMQVLANAETEQDIKVAMELGAAGIGLCRTEHMFFSHERINDVRAMILTDNTEKKSEALQKILSYQEEDFKKIFKILDGKPICIRLLDPPLHEFLPQNENDVLLFCQVTGMNPAEVRKKISALHEYNPMLGHRGCRLGITSPEIYEVQVKAIFNSLIEISDSNVEIMIPFVMNRNEVVLIKELIEKVRREVARQHNITVDAIKYKFGIMIELPKTALIVDKIADVVDFVSFGTNDLTQTTLGISRDDSGKFLDKYTECDIIESDPFVTLDIDGVGELIKIAVNKIRKVKSDVKIGVCGEHGGNPKSIEFFKNTTLDYVSCSPYRVPVAKLAIAKL